MEKIAVFSLSTSKPKLITAVFKEGALLISEIKPLPVGAMEQREKLPLAISKLRQNGFKVLVNELTPCVSAGTGASQVTLKSRHADGRAVIVVGIERYNELKMQRLLSLPAGNQQVYEIPNSIIDMDYNAKGEEVYRVNWPDLRPEHILMILICYATVYHNVASEDYISAMQGDRPAPEKSGLLASFLSVIGYDGSQNKPTSKSLTGCDRDDNTRIL